jgi:hypothetical protein
MVLTSGLRGSCEATIHASVKRVPWSLHAVGQRFERINFNHSAKHAHSRRIAVFAIAHCIPKADIAWNFGAHFLLKCEWKRNL